MNRLKNKYARRVSAFTSVVIPPIGVFVLPFFPTDLFAHAPHDEVMALLLSPGYPRDGTVFAIIRYVILQSTDFGYTWHRLTCGLGHHLLLGLAISPGFIHDKCVFAAGEGGVFRSHDAGLSWKAINNGNADGPITHIAISSTFQVDHRLIALGRTGQLYITQNGGDLWHLISNDVVAAAFAGRAIIIGTRTGDVLLSKDNGLTWIRELCIQNSQAITCLEPVDESGRRLGVVVGSVNGVVLAQIGGECRVETGGLKSQHITSLGSTRNGNGKLVLFATAWQDAVFRSDDEGESWRRYCTGLTKDRQADDPTSPAPHFKGISISPAYASDKTLFLGGFDGIFKSIDGGESWRELTTALSIGLIVGLDLAPVGNSASRIAVTTYVAGVYSRATSQGWEVNNRGLEGRRLFDIAFSPNYSSDNTLFVVSNMVIFKSTDGGVHWEELPLVDASHRLLGAKSRLHSALRRRVRFLNTWLSRDVLRQVNQWLTFKRVAVGIPRPGFGAVLAISPEFKTDRTLFVGGKLGLLRSRDGGVSFRYVFGPSKVPVSSVVISPNYPSDQTVFVAFDEGVYRSEDGGTTWVECLKQEEVKSARLAISPAYGSDRTVFLGTALGLSRSEDGGGLWQRLPIDELYGNQMFVDGLAISPFFDNDHELFVHMCGCGLFHSYDRGDTFKQVVIDHVSPPPALSHMPTFPDRASLIKFSPHYNNDKTVYASSMEHLLKSADGGKCWKVIPRPVRFDNSRPEIAYRGKWGITRDQRFSSASATRSYRPGDMAMMDFVGREICWVGTHGPNQGIAKVTIDGKFAATVDQYSETPVYSIVSFTSSELPYGPHSVTVEVSTDRNPRSSGKYILIEAFDVS